MVSQCFSSILLGFRKEKKKVPRDIAISFTDYYSYSTLEVLRLRGVRTTEPSVIQTQLIDFFSFSFFFFVGFHNPDVSSKGRGFAEIGARYEDTLQTCVMD